MIQPFSFLPRDGTSFFSTYFGTMFFKVMVDFRAIESVPWLSRVGQHKIWMNVESFALVVNLSVTEGRRCLVRFGVGSSLCAWMFLKVVKVNLGRGLWSHCYSALTKCTAAKQGRCFTRVLGLDGRQPETSWPWPWHRKDPRRSPSTLVSLQKMFSNGIKKTSKTKDLTILPTTWKLPYLTP